MSTISYAEFASGLARADSGIDAAEAHGCLCGALCSHGSYPAAEWAAELVDEADGGVPPDLLDLLAGVREQTLEALDGEDMAFTPLLPDDDDALAGRVAALAGWCGGFLYGLGRSGTLVALPDDVDEIVRDFGEIARAGLADEEASEEAEQDYAELVEFVRASVQLAYEALAPTRAAAATPARSH